MSDELKVVSVETETSLNISFEHGVYYVRYINKAGDIKWYDEGWEVEMKESNELEAAYKKFLGKKMKTYFKEKPYRFKSHTEKMRVADQVWDRDDFSCQNPNCSGESFIDSYPHHILSKARGGSDTKENLITLCIECHWQVHQELLNIEIDGEGVIKFIKKD